MKMTLSTHSLQSQAFKGWLFYRHRLVDHADGPSFFAQGDYKLFLDRVTASNGNFAAAVIKDGELWAAVDRIRAYPLFYGQKDGCFYLSDDAYWVRQQVGARRPAAVESAELWYMLYVLGNNTMAPGVSQLRAGDALRVVRTPGGFDVHVEPYYCYLHQPCNADEQELLARLDRVLVATFERLLQTARGRQIVVPLSGGMDSRLIACMLKRLGADNVLAFSYGQPGNRESEVSKYVASKLGYPWQFVSYRDWDWNDPDCVLHRQDFCRFSANLCGLPPILEDWYAVWTMKRQGLLADDAIFCPGHTAGFTSGASAAAEARNIDSPDALVEVILRRQSPRLHWDRPETDVLGGMREHVRQAVASMQTMKSGLAWEPMDLYDCWNWRERQSKRIINMVRTYEYWGYQWRVPLWDSELMEFWSRVAPESRQQKAFYRKCLLAGSDRHFFGLFDPLNDNLKAASPSKTKAGSFMRKALQRYPASRYFVGDKNVERVVAGNYLTYLHRVGRRLLSLEPVTAPWLQLEDSGLDDIWRADGPTPDNPEKESESWRK